METNVIDLFPDRKLFFSKTMDSPNFPISRDEFLKNQEKLGITDDHPKPDCLYLSNESGLNDCAMQPQKTDKTIPDDPIFLEDCLNLQLPVCKNAIDLSIHVNIREKTIFEDAELFARNYVYKLLPITLEVVNETIIHIEHNYCHSESSKAVEGDENRNLTVRNDLEERNYKKRKIKTLTVDSSCDSSECQNGVEGNEDIIPEDKPDELVPASEENSASIQPLDLSLPFLQESKTDNKMLKENQSNIPKSKADVRSSPEIKQYDVHESNKENVTNASKKIEVTISRPGQKEYYQPSEEFLNDVAKISPDLIKNDCYEIDIIDRTNIENFQTEKRRTYYIVSEATWHIFENSTERIILTNDLNIGQPIQNSEKANKPKYLIFDQHSLTESLAKICEKKGGRFEYTYLEESKDLISKEQLRLQVKDCDNQSVSEEEKSETSIPENETRESKSEICVEGVPFKNDKIRLSESKVYLKDRKSSNDIQVSCGVDDDHEDDDPEESKMDVNDADVPEKSESIATVYERINEEFSENIEEFEGCQKGASKSLNNGGKRKNTTMNERSDIRKRRRLSRRNGEMGKESDEDLSCVNNGENRSRPTCDNKREAKMTVERVSKRKGGTKDKTDIVDEYKKHSGPTQTLRTRGKKGVVEKTSPITVMQTRSRSSTIAEMEDFERKKKREPEKKRKEVSKKKMPSQVRLTRSMKAVATSKAAKMVSKADNAIPGPSNSNRKRGRGR